MEDYVLRLPVWKIYGRLEDMPAVNIKVLLCVLLGEITYFICLIYSTVRLEIMRKQKEEKLLYFR